MILLSVTYGIMLKEVISILCLFDIFEILLPEFFFMYMF